eukprot:7651890-Alexandrium_andersonii.AAC.1
MRTKAADNRDLLPIITQLCHAYKSGSPRDVARLQAAVYLSRCVAVIKGAAWFFERGRAQHPDGEHVGLPESIPGFGLGCCFQACLVLQCGQ